MVSCELVFKKKRKGALLSRVVCILPSSTVRSYAYY